VSLTAVFVLINACSDRGVIDEKLIGWISGTITDSLTNQPAFAALVTGDSMPDSTLTDSTGTYVLLVPLGLNQAICGKSGYLQQAKEVHVVSMETTYVNFKLVPQS
jgi:hypothetical protein